MIYRTNAIDFDFLYLLNQSVNEKSHANLKDVQSLYEFD